MQWPLLHSPPPVQTLHEPLLALISPIQVTWECSLMIIGSRRDQWNSRLVVVQIDLIVRVCYRRLSRKYLWIDIRVVNCAIKVKFVKNSKLCIFKLCCYRHYTEQSLKFELSLYLVIKVGAYSFNYFNYYLNISILSGWWEISCSLGSSVCVFSF